MREITGFAGHSAIHADGNRDPIFDGFTASGYRREYTLSEIPEPQTWESKDRWEQRAGFRITLQGWQELLKLTVDKANAVR